MKILVVSPKADGAWFVWLLKNGGHNVDWYLADSKYARTFKGIIPEPLSKQPSPSAYNLVVFDSSGMGDDADYSATLTPTIGNSTLADRLEDDRLFGLQVMSESGIRIPEYEVFDSPEKGIAWLQSNHKRCVFKPIGDDIEDKSTTYVAKSDKDMISFMDKVFTKAKIKSYVLQEVVYGTEVSTEAWWNGDDWFALNHTLEEKKLMAGGLGPATGCSGNVVWMPQRHNPIFQQGLQRVGEFLKKQGYVGMVDLNTIVTEGAVYGLEWTPRFGYEGTSNLTALLPMEFGEFMHQIATRQPVALGQSRHRFAATIRVSVPPYPNADEHRRKLVVPIHGIDCSKLERMVLYDVRKNEDEELETTGIYNCACAPIGCGESIASALEECETAIKQLTIPDAMWRNDLCRPISERFQTLQSQGWLRPLSGT